MYTCIYSYLIVPLIILYKTTTTTNNNNNDITASRLS